MRIKAFIKIGDPEPINQEVSVVVIEGVHGQPVAIACDLGNGAIEAEVLRPGEDNESFNRMLRTLGFDKLVIAESLDKSGLVTDPKAQSKMPLILGN